MVADIMRHLHLGPLHLRTGQGVTPDGGWAWHVRATLCDIEGLPGGAENLETLLVPRTAPKSPLEIEAECHKCIREVLRLADDYGVDPNIRKAIALEAWKRMA